MSLRNSQNEGVSIPGFELYFLSKDKGDVEKIQKNLHHMQHHIKRNSGNYPYKQIEENLYFTVDYSSLINDHELQEDWPNFRDYLVNDTNYVLNCLGLAMHQLIKNSYNGDTKICRIIPVIRARILNFEPVLQLKDVKVSSYGKLISFRGTIIKASTVKIVCKAMAFCCALCEKVFVLHQEDNIYDPPKKCETPGCKSKKDFKPLCNHKLTRTVEWQSVIVQETECDMARIPQTFECELTEDLVKSCSPGDDITISGIVKARDPDSNKGKNKQNAIFNLYLETVSVFNNKSESGGSVFDNFTPEDCETVKQIHAHPNLFRYLVHSLCPKIYGHEIVKAGLLLALFRGTSTDFSRGESHVLLMGDPGLGKSQMLKSCANVSPKGVYVCGTGSTSSGLTVTMTRDPNGEYSLEAGALMMADQGCCCIDEFDKMPSQHACLLEAMEQQCISIAKAGVVCSLPTKPTILVAANPVGGHYDKSKTVAENLKIGSPMLSRFDLIFILLDQPNEHLDKYMSKHILTSHSTNRTKYTPREFEDLRESDKDVYTLKDRLKLNGESLDPLPHKTFRKYLAYAQKYVHPRLSEEAKNFLGDFYVSLRQQFAAGDSTPVTARQLHSLFRLTQARAKVELREVATEQDAQDVIEIMKHSLLDVFTNEAGNLDTTRSQLGSGMSYKNQVMKLLSHLQRQSEIESKSLFSLEEIKDASETAGISKNKFTQALQSLNIQGFLLNKGRDMYQLNSAYL